MKYLLLLSLVLSGCTEKESTQKIVTHTLQMQQACKDLAECGGYLKPALVDTVCQMSSSERFDNFDSVGLYVVKGPYVVKIPAEGLFLSLNWCLRGKIAGIKKAQEPKPKARGRK